MLYAIVWVLSVLAIAAVYYGWRADYTKQLRQKLARKNDRVARMLWAAANTAD